MKTNTIITIGRQFGSGGREIGETIARKLDIPCYDRELITMAAQQSGISEEVFEKADEKASNTLLYALLQASFPISMRPAQITDLPLQINTVFIQLFAKEGNRTFRFIQHVHHRSDRCGFTSTIWTDESKDFPFL